MQLFTKIYNCRLGSVDTIVRTQNLSIYVKTEISSDFQKERISGTISNNLEKWSRDEFYSVVESSDSSLLYKKLTVLRT